MNGVLMKHAAKNGIITLGLVVIAAALFVTAFGIHIALGADEPASARSEPAVPPGDEIIVRGKALEGLKLRIERAEDDVYARFNEINSDDSYDIHCYERAPAGSRIKKRVCPSNALAQRQHAQQLDTERRVQAELLQLAHDDPALGAAVGRLGVAYRALNVVTESQAGETSQAELNAEELPFDAQHLFEVRVGNVAWSHSLTSRTFTLANVDGRIHDLNVACDKTAAKLNYETDAEWTLPDSWGACKLQVSAKRGTSFALYEFE